MATLQIALAVAEVRDLLVGAATAIALGVIGAFLIVGGAALAWTAWQFTHLKAPKATLTSLEETWRWLETQLRSRLRSR